MRNVQIGTQTFQVPESWEECTSEQLLLLLPLRLVDMDSLRVGERARIKWKTILSILNAPAKLTLSLEIEDRLRLARLTSWIWKQKEIKKKPFTSFLFQEVKYILPDPGYANTSAIEIAMANIQYLAFGRKKNPNVKAIYQLVATLCRPERKDLQAFKTSTEWNGDIREEYNTVIAQERASQFEKGNLPAGVVMGMLYYFEWMNSNFLKQYRDVYSDDDSEEEPLYQNGEGLITTLMEVAKSGTFGDFEKVCKQNGHTIWIFLKDSSMKIKKYNMFANN
ncbi:hypothetical protein BWI97_08655 [Siphonobacter sp. BAB-5405]|uniref:hypothetical protein n=1 Tax=Siphonobacter sp. BAB-5405 TaxID=1864825 RepID=UPI000C7FAC98|nr:hypothetical protein [Siphonobacter sp. BAB-5405]PMD97669.1 hypothetical protein BWI97_08655 [Siphonobacter sp. BAB-5405]